MQSACMEVFWYSDKASTLNTKVAPSNNAMYTPNIELGHPLVELLMLRGICQLVVYDTGGTYILKASHPVCDISSIAEVIITGPVRETEGCGDGQYQCTDKHCVSLFTINDGDRDCPDGSDEPRIIHASLWFTGTRQIPLYRVCDSVRDTADGGDEELCNQDIITPRIMQIPTLNNTGYDLFLCKDSNVRIPTDWVDDLIPDCPIVKPEASMSEDEPALAKIAFTSSKCLNASYLPCLTGHHRCYPINSLCKYELDKYGHLHPCRNGAHLFGCHGYSCSGMYLCPASYCLPVLRVCDGVDDCPDGADEQNCLSIAQSLECQGFLRCKGGGCVHQRQVCDGKMDCPIYGDDEMLCEKRVCPSQCFCYMYAIECSVSVRRKIDLSNTKYLSIRHSNIFPIVSSGNLVVVLNLSNNVFDEIPTRAFQAVSNVALIDLSNTKIIQISKSSFSNLRNLRKILFTYGHITRIQSDAFVNLPLVKELNFSNTSLRMLDTEAIISTPNLTIIDISFCKLKALNLSSIFNFSTLTLIRLQGNPLETVDLSDISIDTVVETDLPYTCCFIKCTNLSISTFKYICPLPTDELETGRLWPWPMVVCIAQFLSMSKTKGGGQQRFSILLSLSGIAVCVHSFMVLMQNAVFPTAHIQDEGGMKFWWCLMAAVFQYTGIYALPPLSVLGLLPIYIIYNISLKNRILFQEYSNKLLAVAIFLILLPGIILLMLSGITDIKAGLTQYCSFFLMPDSSHVQTFVILDTMYMVTLALCVSFNIYALFRTWKSAVALERQLNTGDSQKSGVNGKKIIFMYIGKGITSFLFSTVIVVTISIGIFKSPLAPNTNLNFITYTFQ